MDEGYRGIFGDKRLEDAADTAVCTETEAAEGTDDLKTPAENNAADTKADEAAPVEQPIPPQIPVNKAEQFEANMSEPDGRFDKISDSLNEFKESNDILNGKVDSMAEQLGTLKSVLSRLAAYDTAVETLKQSLTLHKTHENNLNKEVEEYKKGTYFTNIRPFLMFLIEMLCELKKSGAQYAEDKEEFIAENNEGVYNEIINLIGFYADSFENQLKIQGVTITSYEADTDYIPGRQRITKTVKTDDRDKNGKTALVMSDCYSYEKTVLKPANVSVYKFG